MLKLSVLLAGILTASAFGQTLAIGGFSPIPVLPQGGQVPFDSKQYVYLGPTAHEVTLSYPQRLAEGDTSGPRSSLRFNLINQVAPSVTTNVTERSEGLYAYSFTIQNSSSASQPIYVWALGAPSTLAVSSVTKGSWTAVSETNPEVPTGALTASNPIHFVSWHAGDGPSIQPGGAQSGFEVTSTFRPGFTLAYARSRESFAIPSELPTPVLEQIAVLYQPEWLNRTTLVIGPRYPKGWSAQFIAADYLYGLKRLVQSGQLSSTSPFVTGATSSLETFVQTQGASTFVPLNFLERANSPLEQSIAGAMRTSLVAQ